LKQRKALILIFAANTVSSFAQGITMIAIPWYLIQMEGGKFLNASMVGIVTFLSLFWGLYAGTLVDRYNRKHIFLTLNTVDACILLGIAGIGFWLGNLPFFLIATVYLSTIFTYNVHFPNVYAFIQELFEAHQYSKINSALEVQHQTTAFLGMMIGGLLLDGTPAYEWWPAFLHFDPWPLHQIFLLDGTTYVIAGLLISQIPYTPSVKKKIDEGKLVERLVQGFAYLRANKPLFIFGMASYVVFFAVLVTIQVALPVYVKDYLREPALILSSFKGIYSLGAVSAGILGLTFLFKKGNPIRKVIFLVGMAGILFSVLAVNTSIAVALLIAYLLGISNAGARILRITYLFKIVPNHVIGRVNSVFNVLNVLMRVTFFGILALPFFAGEENGANIVYGFGLMAGVMFFAVGILILRFRTFPDMDETKSPEEVLPLPERS